MVIGPALPGKGQYDLKCLQATLAIRKRGP
jgi:hypothetical protein